MKNFFKQTGKAICYIGLFAGMQLLAVLIFSNIYSRQLEARIAAGEQISELEMLEGINIFIFENTGWMVVLYGLMTLFFVWFIFAVQKKKVLKETGIVVFSGKMILPIILLAVSSVLVIQCAFELLPIPEEMLLEYEESIVGMMGGSIISILFANVIMAPVVEEVIFRGLVLSRLRKAMPTALAVTITSIAFGLFHGQILWICYATLLGIMMSFVAINCKSVLASMLYHVVFNFFGSFPIFGLFFGNSRMTLAILQVVSLAAVAAIIYWMIKLLYCQKQDNQERGKKL